MGKGTREKLDKGTHRRQLAKGDASGQSIPDSRSDQSAWVNPVPVREGRSRWVGIPTSFVEISLEIHASVSLHMHKEMQCYITPLLHFELTHAYCSFVLFPTTPLIVYLVAMKKCVIPLSEPLVDHRPRSEMVKKLTYSGAEGVSSHCITRVLSSHCLVSYPGHLLWECYPSAEKRSAYSTAPADWTKYFT